MTEGEGSQIPDVTKAWTVLMLKRMTENFVRSPEGEASVSHVNKSLYFPQEMR